MYSPLKHSLLSRRAFTLIELLVVIVIIAILAVIALPVYSSFTARAAETKTLSNMRQMGSAMLLYSNDNFNQLPGRVTSNKWPTLLKPYVQNYAMYSSPIPDVNGKSYKVTDQTQYFRDDENVTSYIYNGFNDMGAFTDATYTPRLNQIALPSATIMLGIPYPQTKQFYMDFVEGGGNNNEILNRTAFFNGCVYVFCDGSARVLKYSTTIDERSQPTGSGDYADWYWLTDKSRTSIIQ